MTWIKTGQAFKSSINPFNDLLNVKGCLLRRGQDQKSIETSVVIRQVMKFHRETFQSLKFIYGFFELLQINFWIKWSSRNVWTSESGYEDRFFFQKFLKTKQIKVFKADDCNIEPEKSSRMLVVKAYTNYQVKSWLNIKPIVN